MERYAAENGKDIIVIAEKYAEGPGRVSCSYIIVNTSCIMQMH